MAHSNVRLATVSRHISVAMAIAIVAICRTRKIVRPVSPAAVIAPSHGSNVTITSALPCRTFAMALTIAVTILTNHRKCARTLIAIRYGASNAPTIDALPDIKSVMALIIVAMEAMRTI